MTKMPSLTFYGGVNEIGGNKILLEADGTRIFLDFGMSFKIANQYFAEFLQPRKCTALADFFELGLLPDIKGIYRVDYLTHMDRPSEEERSVDAVLLSHAHADHAQYIHFLRTDIPIYCTKATKTILHAVDETGSNPLSDLITACDAFTFYTNKKGNLSRVTRRNTEFVHERIYHVLEPENRVTIGSLEIEMVPVDHSLPGACGYIIRSDEGNLVYTGDIRFHGSNQALSKKFVEKAKAAKPKWLVSEGTRIDSTQQDSEAGVKDVITQLVAKAKGLIFVEHPIRDLDRVNTIFEAAQANKREFVVTFKLAYLIEALGALAPFALGDVKILVPKKSWGLISKDGIDRKLVEQDYANWEKAFINRANSITCNELQQKPEHYVVSMSLWEINQLTDIQPEAASWIKSSCEPFSDEMVLDEERKRNWLAHFGIKEYFAHASGHASGAEIKAIITEINPDRLYPVHTEHQEMFQEFFRNVEMVELGKRYTL
ncbi:MAG TPA: MBL fold metallo-hydrolase [Candidatus Bathyarchaeia archaeon]|nr:MBL fold metallo-hydrolase [Candidatus Bathyarchaeia archaeon]